MRGLVAERDGDEEMGACSGRERQRERQRERGSVRGLVMERWGMMGLAMERDRA